jgi:predicted nucleotidyltransferase
MDVARPYTVIAPTLDPGVLSVLAGTNRQLTGREIARLLGRPSHSGVIAALDRLVVQGLVEREEAGRSFLFTLNREHLAAPAAELLAGLREDLLRRIRNAVDAWAVEPDHLSLFGSAARGDGGTDSDIDLFVVRPEAVQRENDVWRAQLDVLAVQIERWTGNPVRIAEMGRSEAAQLRKDRPAIVDELGSDAITLAGFEVSTLLEEA